MTKEGKFGRTVKKLLSKNEGDTKKAKITYYWIRNGFIQIVRTSTHRTIKSPNQSSYFEYKCLSSRIQYVIKIYKEVINMFREEITDDRVNRILAMIKDISENEWEELFEIEAEAERETVKAIKYGTKEELYKAMHNEYRLKMLSKIAGSFSNEKMIDK